MKGARRPAVRRAGFVHGLLGRTLTVLLAAGSMAACSLPQSRVQPRPVPGAEAGVELLDPVGVYDLVMSSQIMVTEGTMQIRGEPGNYVGTVAVGSVGGRIRTVETGEGHMVVHIDTGTGALVFRLAGDGSSFSGNWVMGERRGTIVVDRSRDRPR